MLYNLLKFLHIASIAVWLGGIVTMLTLNRLFHRSGDAAMQALGKQGGVLSMRLFMPAVLVTVVTGIGMVQVGPWNFGLTWIQWGIVGAVGSFIVGGALTGGTARKLAQGIARGDLSPAAAAALQGKILMFALLNIALLLSIVWAMVFKPA